MQQQVFRWSVSILANWHLKHLVLKPEAETRKRQGLQRTKAHRAQFQEVCFQELAQGTGPMWEPPVMTTVGLPNSPGQGRGTSLEEKRKRENRRKWRERTNNLVTSDFCYSQTVSNGWAADTCEGHLCDQINWKHLVHGPQTANRRNLLSHFIALGKTRRGWVGQGSKEEMPSVTPGRGASSLHSLLPRVGSEAAFPRSLPIKGSYAWIIDNINSVTGWDRFASHPYFSLSKAENKMRCQLHVCAYGCFCGWAERKEGENRRWPSEEDNAS